MMKVILILLGIVAILFAICITAILISTSNWEDDYFDIDAEFDTDDKGDTAGRQE